MDDALLATVHDYFEGWYDGDAERMRRALHPELAKRSLDTTGALETVTADAMIEATARGVGRERGSGDRTYDIDVVDLYGDIATVVVRSAVYREYLHLARTPAGWKIVNALWRFT